jgi:hypothetical protein
VLIALGALLGLPAALLLALVANLLPLEWLLPKTVRVTGPVEADARAVFWIGVFLLAGSIVTWQGLRRLRRRNPPGLPGVGSGATSQR